MWWLMIRWRRSHWTDNWWPRSTRSVASRRWVTRMMRRWDTTTTTTVLDTIVWCRPFRTVEVKNRIIYYVETTSHKSNFSGGGYSDYTTGGGYNAGYNTGYNTGYSGLGGRYTAGGYTSGLGGYNGLNAAYGAPYTSTIGTGYSSLGGYSSGLGGYSGVGAYSGLGGYSGFAGSYPNTRASYVAPLSSSVYNQNSGYYY